MCRFKYCIYYKVLHLYTLLKSTYYVSLSEPSQLLSLQDGSYCQPNSRIESITTQLTHRYYSIVSFFNNVTNPAVIITVETFLS